jgi:type I restriction-modification system DNA methylase subunit
MTNGNGSLTFKWLVGILGVVLFSVITVIAADTRSSIKDAAELAKHNYEVNQAKIVCLEREKLDKDQYYRDLREIKATLNKIDEKLDRIRK